MSNANRWKAYEIVSKFDMPEMEKDFALNCIVNVSEKKIAKTKSPSRIVGDAFWQLKRRKKHRISALGGVGSVAMTLLGGKVM